MWSVPTWNLLRHSANQYKRQAYSCRKSYRRQTAWMRPNLPGWLINLYAKAGMSIKLLSIR